MKTYRLKNGPAFQMVDGPMKGHVFEPGVIYADIPETMTGRFVEVEPPAVEPTNTMKPKKGVTDNEITPSEA